MKGLRRKGAFLFIALAVSLSLLIAQDSPSVGLRLIVVASLGEAEQALDQLKNGVDFGPLAKAKSIDPTAIDEGYLGKLNPATLRPELRDAVRGVAPGQFTGVVRIPTGFAILKVLTDSESPEIDDPGPLRILSATGTGAVKDAIPVSGLTEADALFLGFPKPAGWNQNLRTMCEIRQQSIPAILKRLEEDPDATSRDAGDSVIDRMQAHYAWAQIYAYIGEMGKAIDRWQFANRIAEAQLPASLPMMLETLGLAHLHKSEMDNGSYREPAEWCLFPPRSSESYRDTSDSLKAVDYFTRFLAQKPDDFEVRWLLNLAQMTLGRYPGGVSPQHVIPLTAFASGDDIGRFVDVAPQAGLRAFSLAGGAIADDFNNDGLLDVVTSSMDVCEPLHYFQSQGDGTFAERTAQAGLSDQLGGLNLIQADYNNDGCADVLVLRGGWEFAMRKSLLRNNCHGAFTDVTRESGIGKTPTATQTAVWADIDNDGALDLFAGSENGPSQLFRNKGDGTFDDISQFAGVDRSAFTKGVVAADYDNDRYVDFYVSNYNGHNFLYHNNGNRTFTEVGKQAGVEAPWRSFAAWFFDYDNDGWTDLWVNGYDFSTEEVMRSYLGRPYNAETSKLYKNLGNGTFKDVTAAVGLDKVFMTMAANFGDVDNDGFLDMYLGMGSPSFASMLPHELLLNKGAKSFVSVTASSGTGELHKGHGIAFADLDRDGDQDIVAEIGGAVPADRHALRLFENPGNAGDWINLRLVGVKSNKAALGARIKLTVENLDEGRSSTAKAVTSTPRREVRAVGTPVASEAKQSPRIREIHRTVGSGGSFGASPMEQHIGLGRRARIHALEIWWPTSNTRQTFANVGTRQFIEIQELATDYSRLERKAFKLGGR